MRTGEQVYKDFTNSTNDLLGVLNNFPEEFFNIKPEGGGWSAGQIGEHLIKSEIGCVRFFANNPRPAGRDPEAKISVLKKKMDNLDKKLTAFGAIIPDDKRKDKQKVIEKLQDIRQRLTNMIETEDLSKIFTAFDHPVFGPLTRIEWLYFNRYHGERHRQQIIGLQYFIESKF